MFTALAIVAGLAAVAALACGIGAMANNGEVAHRRSETWMGWRVAFQAAALLFIVLAIIAAA